MSENLTALASENLNPSLRGLLEDVQRGHIRVPRFQRPFVWKDDQRIELLRSIRDNMPIGSLLVWRTIKFRLASFSVVGSHCISPIVNDPPTIGWQYILDGHQRVSTLLGLLLKPVNAQADQETDEDTPDWDIQFDLMDQEFVFAKGWNKRKSGRPLLPLWTLFDGRLVNKHMRDIRKQGGTKWVDTDMDEWEVRADQLSYRFQQYRIPVVIMVTDDLGLAAKTFQRINSLGTPMGESHFVAALTWDIDFDLREQIESLKESLPIGWRGINEGIFLQVCKGLVNLDITRSGQTELVKALKNDDSLLGRAGKGVQQAIAILSEKACVVRQELLPYAFQLVLLAVELERDDVQSYMSEDRFAMWFWRTCWSEVFGSASYRQVKTEHDTLRKNTIVQWERERGLPQRFDFRLARVRLFVLRLALRSGLFGGDGQPVDGRTLLNTHGREALVQLFPVPRTATATLKKLLQGAGNRFFIDPAMGSTLRSYLENGPDLPFAALEAHFVDTVALAALRRGDLETFISSRAQAMDQFDCDEYQALASCDEDECLVHRMPPGAKKHFYQRPRSPRTKNSYQIAGSE